MAQPIGFWSGFLGQLEHERARINDQMTQLVQLQDRRMQFGLMLNKVRQEGELHKLRVKGLEQEQSLFEDIRGSLVKKSKAEAKTAGLGAEEAEVDLKRSQMALEEAQATKDLRMKGLEQQLQKQRQDIMSGFYDMRSKAISSQAKLAEMIPHLASLQTQAQFGVPGSAEMLGHVQDLFQATQASATELMQALPSIPEFADEMTSGIPGGGAGPEGIARAGAIAGAPSRGAQLQGLPPALLPQPNTTAPKPTTTPSGAPAIAGGGTVMSTAPQQQMSTQESVSQMLTMARMPELKQNVQPDGRIMVANAAEKRRVEELLAPTVRRLQNSGIDMPLLVTTPEEEEQLAAAGTIGSMQTKENEDITRRNIAINRLQTEGPDLSASLRARGYATVPEANPETGQPTGNIKNITDLAESHESIGDLNQEVMQMAEKTGSTDALGIALKSGQMDEALLEFFRAHEDELGWTDPDDPSVIWADAAKPRRDTMGSISNLIDVMENAPGQTSAVTVQWPDARRQMEFLPPDVKDLIGIYTNVGDPQAAANMLRRAIPYIKTRVNRVETGTGSTVVDPNDPALAVVGKVQRSLEAILPRRNQIISTTEFWAEWDAFVDELYQAAPHRRPPARPASRR